MNILNKTPTNNNFAFMSNRVRLKDDPKFVNIEETIKCLAYVFTRHMDIWLSIAQYNIDSNAVFDIDAGKVFNQLIASSPMPQNLSNRNELTDDQFNKVVQTFKTYFDNPKNNSLKLAHYSKSYKDPISCMWEFCYYLFVPVRLDPISIPQDVKINSLRKWLSVAFALPFMKSYTDKYVNAINNIPYLQSVYDKFIDNPTFVERFIQLDESFARDTINRLSNPNLNPTKTFLRVFMNVFLNASIEIMRKYCPNYVECFRINPNYDGAWINPFDSVFTDQVSELGGLSVLFQTQEIL